MANLSKLIKFILLIELFLLSSCSLLKNTDKKIRIETTPSMATITIISDNGQVRTIGQSPLEISESELFRGSNMILMQATLNGFKETNVYIPKTDRLNEMNLTLRLKEIPLLESKKSDQVNNLVSEIAKAQALIFQKKYPAAQIILEKLTTSHPDIAVIRDLLGNSLYLSGKNKDALDMYMKAELLDPNNGSRKIIINKLKEQ